MTMKPIGTYAEIPIENVIDNPENARKVFDPGKIDELATSIKATGLQQLPVVTAIAGEPGRFMLESGARRRLAIIKLGWPMLPCIVKTRESILESEVAGLADNLQRENLTPVEISAKLAALKETHKLSGSTIAKMLGLSTSYVNRLIGLRELLADNVIKQWEGGNPKATVDFLHGLTKVPKEKQIEAFQDESANEGSGEESESTPKTRETKRNCRKAAEQLLAAMLAMSAEDCAAVKAKECVSYILGGRQRPPAGIRFKVTGEASEE